jgi:uncharacterized membrane protein YecN with MAPEG domain
MTLVYLVMMLALLQFWLFGLAVGSARVKYGVPAPATSGNPDFERVYRVQMNTLEQLAIFIPSMLVYAHFINARWAAGLGAVYVIGRVIYFIGYSKDAKKRGWGFLVSSLPVIILMAGSLFALVRALFTSGSL